MRFLFLHEAGTNSQVLETQTAALRYELGDYHTYVYVEGVIPAPIAEAYQRAQKIKTLYPATASYYTYYNQDPSTCVKALSDLVKFIDRDGPFDGMIGFSNGAALAATMLLGQRRLWSMEQNPQSSIKMVVLLSSSSPGDPLWLLEKGMIKAVDEDQGRLIDIPTAHIWGKNDKDWAETSANVVHLCIADKRTVLIHEGGHEFPGGKDKSAVLGAVHAIRRTINTTSDTS